MNGCFSNCESSNTQGSFENDAIYGPSPRKEPHSLIGSFAYDSVREGHRPSKSMYWAGGICKHLWKQMRTSDCNILGK